MPRKKTDKDDTEQQGDVTPDESVESAADLDQPESLVGSGTPMLRVRAHARVLGLAPGQTNTVVDSDEVRANARVGNLTILPGE
jgi:hypothetical protein